MLLNLLKYSFRALKKQKFFMLINISGLAIGLVCSIIIALFIINEFNYDRYHENKDKIYRVILHGKLGGQEVQVTSTASVIAPTMYNEFPEVASFLRMNPAGREVLKYEDRFFTDNLFAEADSTFFDFFSIPLLKGDPKTALSQPYYLVLSESTAKKIFGDEDPLNKMIQIGSETTHYMITGVMQDIPENTHFEVDMIGSFATNPRSTSSHWLSNSFETYVMLKPNTAPESVNTRFAPMIEKYVGPEVVHYFGISIEEFFEAGNIYRMFLQPLDKIHLNPDIEQGFKPANDPRYLWIFGSVAVLIIIIASVNFMNLSTAQATRRAKEIGIKKVCGTRQSSLVLQFLLETFVLSFFALLLALLVTRLVLPYFNDLLDLNLHIGLFENWYTIPALLLMSLIIGILAGLYPALFLSSFNPNEVLKGKTNINKGNGRLRSILVVVQFTISIILIVGTAIMYRQLDFMQKKDLGFDKEQIYVISNARALGDKVGSFKEELLNVNGIMAVSASTAIPGRNNNQNGYTIKSRPEESFLMQTSYADPDFLKTYGIRLESGRFFNENDRSQEDGCIINQTAVKNYQFDDPYSIRISLGDNDEGERVYMPVIGVVEDFHHESLRSPISPYLFRFKGERINWGYISIRLAKGKHAETISRIEEKWESFTAGSPISAYYLENDVDRMYREEKQNSRLSVVFAILGIIIAALGLFGLTSFSIAQRTREIGIRKTYGAGIYNIWYLFAREIVILVSIASLIAVPLIWWVADNWLQNYHYRISLGWVEFVFGLLIAVLIALLTISYRTIKTAKASPTTSLRYE